MVDRCECGNEPPSSIKCWECSLFPSLLGLRTYQHPCLYISVSSPLWLNSPWTWLNKAETCGRIYYEMIQYELGTRIQPGEIKHKIIYLQCWVSCYVISLCTIYCLCLCSVSLRASTAGVQTELWILFVTVRCLFIFMTIYRVRQKKCIHNLTKENSTLYNRLL